MITVRYLIAFLSQFPPDARVVTASRNFELNAALVDANVCVVDGLTRVNKEIRDAFDGETYTTAIYEPDTDCKDAVVVISG